MTVETPAQTVARLLTALEDLVDQETVLLHSGNYQGVLRTQQRAAPLVECLAGLGAAAGDAARDRIASVVNQRRASENWLAGALARGRDELRQLRIDQRRLGQVRPAYGGATSGGRQLSARG